MGVTVFVGDCIGAGKPEKAGKGIGTGIAIFAVLAVVVTAFVVPFSDTLASFMHAPCRGLFTDQRLCADLWDRHCFHHRV